MDLKGRKTDAWGNVIFSLEGLIDHLMKGGSVLELQSDNGEKIQEFNYFCKKYDREEMQISTYVVPPLSLEEWDNSHQQNWFTPEPYSSINVLVWLLDKCTRAEEIDRIQIEWRLFEERGMEKVLRHLIYMVADFRERNVVWGVGRGSSVASYALYLIGIHRIDSILYDLDITEFLK